MIARDTGRRHSCGQTKGKERVRGCPQDEAGAEAAARIVGVAVAEEEVIGSEIQSMLLLFFLLLLSLLPPNSRVSFCFPGEAAEAAAR